MKRYISNIILALAFAVTFTSCNAFLEEDPKTFLSPDAYFQSEAQITAAVNGVYTFLDDCFTSSLELGSCNYLFLEYLHGYGDRVYAGSFLDLSQAINLDIKEDNWYIQNYWQTGYFAIENCNSIIESFDKVTTDIISEANKNKLYGEVYFLRAYNYFNLVRLFGELPLKVTSTKSEKDGELPLSSIETVYAQIERDLVVADSLMANNSWASIQGRVAKGAVKSLMANVYITMAGYPLQKGTTYYQKAYEAAKEVVAGNAFYLFDSYAGLRDVANENSGENIWMIQCESQYAGSPVHANLLPYPAVTPKISSSDAYGGALAPAQAFYESYTEGDLRVAEKGFYFTKHESLDNANEVVELGRPYIYKFWDDDCAKTGKSGKNYCLIRYADVLLMLAEAKAQADGGTTSNADAIDAYYKVRHRANPNESRPASISVNDILKERFWEICFEGQTWYDMLRTRKAFNVITGNIVNMIGYNAPSHSEGHAFEEADLLFPYPLREKRLNANLVRN
ncbi:MAG: RagB/SusD family nutrient uptake outer membrane protein [Dysgonamonadaceae bacterium]|jgi:hypothetical protein|nr:RagB/SusD family nutrient uptake outer membrane protein [Dysgonamonadaceae bacterium]